MQNISKHLQAIISNLSQNPGVYKMKDINQKVIYVGKAKNLKNRIKSYFQNTKQQGIKTQKMVGHIEDIECIELHSEIEALILETNYIKDLRPKYNILMKDDKNFVYIRIPIHDDFPKISIERQLKKDGAKYFGPRTSKGDIEKQICFLQKLFFLHTCTLNMQEVLHNNQYKVLCKGSLNYPCLEYQMKRCIAPCIANISSKEYKENIKKIILFFEGHHLEILEVIKQKMLEAAEKKQFEKAASLRNLMQAIQKEKEKQIVSTPLGESQDIIGIFHDLGKTYASLFQVRVGKMIHNEQFCLNNEGDYEEIIQAFITEYYTKTEDMPQYILIPQDIENTEVLSSWFEQELHTKITIQSPKKGQKNELIQLAMNNAKNFAKAERLRWENNKRKTDEAKMNIIQLIYGNIIEKPITKESIKGVSHIHSQIIKSFPHRMECFDISHLSGDSTVASLVVFIDGKEMKSEYKKYQLKTLQEGMIDDFLSMYEILTRRVLEIENILHIQNQDQDNSHATVQKMKKKEIQEWFKKHKKIEDIQEDLQYYGLKNSKNYIYIAGLKKHKNTLFEIIHEEIHTDSLSKYERIFFQKLFDIFKGKDLWILSDNRERFENFGFKKLKELHKNWIQTPGLVPEEISTPSQKEEGYALKIRIPKSTKTNNLPDFILIDGGKGQLSSVIKVFEENNWNYMPPAIYEISVNEKSNYHSYGGFQKYNHRIILCSVAKKEEEFFFPYEKQPRNFSNTSEGSYLLQRLRDESHRFAISFHRSSHMKKALQSELDHIVGIGPASKKKLLKTFGSVQNIMNASKENLVLCVGEKVATTIIQKQK
jgi:excinuclease ABC subunit C